MIQCLLPFNERGITARPGDILDIHPDIESWLCDSWPACWARYERPAAPAEATPEAVEMAAIDAPPVDKMMQAAPRKKGRK